VETIDHPSHVAKSRRRYPELISELLQVQLGIGDQDRYSQWNSGGRLQILQYLSPAVLGLAHRTCLATGEKGVYFVWKGTRPYASRIEESGGDQTYGIFRPRGSA
jgi:hypothetical protein